MAAKGVFVDAPLPAQRFCFFCTFAIAVTVVLHKLIASPSGRIEKQSEKGGFFGDEA